MNKENIMETLSIVINVHKKIIPQQSTILMSEKLDLPVHCTYSRHHIQLELKSKTDKIQ